MRNVLVVLVGLAGCGDNLSMGNTNVRPDAPSVDAPAADSPQLEPMVLTPSPYLKNEDSPFKGLATWHLEDFEDGLLDDLPGTTDNNGVNTRSISADVDSVDADDGVEDDACANCDSWHNPTSSPEVQFTFSATGGLPTHAGLVWTDAATAGLTVTFEAFDGQGTSLGTATLPAHSDADNQGTTAEDRFFGVIAPDGVGSIRIQNSGGGIEVDHVQWGR